MPRGIVRESLSAHSGEIKKDRKKEGGRRRRKRQQNKTLPQLGFEPAAQVIKVKKRSFQGDNSLNDFFGLIGIQVYLISDLFY